MVLILKALAAAALTLSTTFAKSGFSDPVYPKMSLRAVAVWGDASQVYGVQVDFVSEENKDQSAFHGISTKGEKKIMPLDSGNLHITGFRAYNESDKVKYLHLYTNSPESDIEFGSSLTVNVQLLAPIGQHLGGFKGEVLGKDDGLSALTALYPLFVTF